MADAKEINFLKYAQEYKLELFSIFRSRLRLFCFMTIAVFIATSVFYLLASPAQFKKAEFFSWGILIGASILVLLINEKVKTLFGAKLDSFLFSCAGITAIAILFIIYPQYVYDSASLFAVEMFFICFIMPWSLGDVCIIWLLNIIAYNAIFIQLIGAKNFNVEGYIDGITFLIITLILCLVVRKNDNRTGRQNFALLREVEEKNAQMQKELELAREIQSTLIPKSISTENADIAVSYVPISSVGGDYATFHVTKEGNLFFLISDVTGHGVPAALLVNRIYAEIENLARHDCAPGVVLKKLDKFVQENFKSTSMYISACCGLLDFTKKSLLYSNYGHPPQILHERKRDKIFLLESQTYLLGLAESKGTCGIFEGKCDFEHGDRMILFTDGLIETTDALKEMYGMERLETFAKDNTMENPAVFNSNLLRQVGQFRKGPVEDDIFLLTIDIK